MNNREIAAHFGLLANLMELHNEDAFKIKSYSYAARYLKNMDIPLAELELEELQKIEGIGKAIAAKIFSLVKTGKLDLLQKYLDITPAGIVQLLQIKGIGPKKIGQLWKELGIESIGELEYACNENRLLELKGFGKKTQDAILHQLKFILEHSNKYMWASLEELADEMLHAIREQFPGIPVSVCGEFRRKEIVLPAIDILIASEDKKIRTALSETYKDDPVVFHYCKPDEFYLKLLELSSDEKHFSFLSFKIDANKKYASEESIYKDAGYPFIPPELRDNKIEWMLAEKNVLDELIDVKDIRGVVHSHSDYSDGSATLKQLAQHCKDNGFEYLVISDHSRSAFYANGLSVQRMLEQHDEINKLNKQLAPFQIYKSIESDILNDGSLDYDPDILQRLDLVIASVHSQLKMPEDKATARLIKAVENPYTTILGHMTGRLLLSRAGYAVDHKKVIDACAANGVCIEVNANPRRLDIDYSWIPYCMEKNVLISINPDAHSLHGVEDIRYGVYAARKGGLLKQYTLNSLSNDNFDKYIRSRKQP